MSAAKRRYDIRDSTGVQAGDHNLQVNVTNHRYRGWFLLVALLAVAALTALFLNDSDSRPELELSAFVVQKPSTVSGQIIDTGGTTRGVVGSDEVDTTAIDITLKNNGDEPAVLTGLELTVRYAERLEDCRSQGGPVVVAAEYLVTLPDKTPATPFTLEKDIRFEIRGGVTDRFTITVGPATQTVEEHAPNLIVADVALRQDDGELIEIGTAAVVTQAGEGLANLSVAPVEAADCIAANQRRIDEVFEIPATRAEEYAELKSRYARLARARTQPGRKACAEPADDGPIFGMCAEYDTNRFQVELGVLDHPELGAAVTMRVRSPDGVVDYTYEYRYDVSYDGTYAWQLPVDTPRGMYLDVSGPGGGNKSVLFTGQPGTDVLVAGELEVEIAWSAGPSATMPLPTISVVLA
jgi:hypothetical protein